jgi:hypothetical protein
VRGTAFGVFFFATVGPWIAMAIAGVLDSGSAIIVAAPSPLYIVPMIDALAVTDGSEQHKLLAGLASAVGWALLGTGLLGAAILRVRRLLREHDAAERQFEALLESEASLRGVEEPRG